MFVAVIVCTVAGQYAIIQYGGEFTSTVPLSPQEWFQTSLIGSFSLAIGFFMRFVPVSEDPRTFSTSGAASNPEYVAIRQSLASKLVNFAVVLVPMYGAFACWALVLGGETVGVEGIVRVVKGFVEHIAKVVQNSHGEL